MRSRSTSACGRRSSKRSRARTSTRPACTTSAEVPSTAGRSTCWSEPRESWSSWERRSAATSRSRWRGRRRTECAPLLLAGSRATADPPERRELRERMLEVVRDEGIEGWNREFSPPGPGDRTTEELVSGIEALRDRRDATEVVSSFEGPLVASRRRPGRPAPGRRGAWDRRVSPRRPARGRRGRGSRRQRRRTRALQRDPARAPAPGRLTGTFSFSRRSRSISAFVGA